MRVIKLGGSLLSDSALPERFRRWLDAQPAARNVLIAGGGSFAEAVRDADRTYRLDPVAAHWLAIDCLGLTARLAAAILPPGELVFEWNGLRRRVLQAVGGTEPKFLIFDVVGFMRQIEPRLGEPSLPQTWEVTSDSIAARVANALAAEELVLLKSTLPPSDRQSVQSAAADGYVDPWFPQAVQRVRKVRCVDLADPVRTGSDRECLLAL